jgi:hypothetical protein
MIKSFWCALIPWHNDRLRHKLWFIFQISNVHHDASNLEQHNDIFGHEIYIWSIFHIYNVHNDASNLDKPWKLSNYDYFMSTL